MFLRETDTFLDQYFQLTVAHFSEQSSPKKLLVLVHLDIVGGLARSLHLGVRLLGIVMVCTEPFVERKIDFAIVALEVSVVQLMEVGCRRDPPITLQQEFVEADMTLCGSEGSVLGVHQQVDGMRGHNPVDQYGAEVNDMLDRVHGQARPWSDVDVLVVKIVSRPVERWPVCDAVCPIEMEQSPHLDAAEDCHEIDRLRAWIDIWHHLIGIRPHHQDLISSPDDATTHTTPEDVIAQLVSPHEFSIADCHPVGCVFIFESLSLERPEPEMPGANDPNEQQLISDEHLQNPIRPEFSTT